MLDGRREKMGSHGGTKALPCGDRRMESCSRRIVEKVPRVPDRVGPEPFQPACLFDTGWSRTLSRGTVGADAEEDNLLADNSKARRWCVPDGRNPVGKIEQSLADPTDEMGMMLLTDGLESGWLSRVVEADQLLLTKELSDMTVDRA